MNNDIEILIVGDSSARAAMLRTSSNLSNAMQIYKIQIVNAKVQNTLSIKTKVREIPDRLPLS